MNTQLQKYAHEHSWGYKMNNSKGLDSWNNYTGPDMGDLVVVVGHNRDSDILTKSNFSVALDLLGGESDNVQVSRFGHWGSGWFELILVNPKSLKHLKIAYDIHNKLEEYPVLDDADYSERESESYAEYAENSKSELSDALSQHFGVKRTKTLEDIAYALNMECQYQNGEEGCVNIYTCRAPDAYDIKHLKSYMDGIAYNYRKSRVFKALVKALQAKV